MSMFYRKERERSPFSLSPFALVSTRMIKCAGKLDYVALRKEAETSALHQKPTNCLAGARAFGIANEIMRRND